MICNFVNTLENILNTDNCTPKTNPKDTSKLTRLQKMDRYPLVSTISGIARIILSTLYFIASSFRGDALKGMKEFITGVPRGAFVSLPFIGNFIAMVLDTETFVTAYSNK